MSFLVHKHKDHIYKLQEQFHISQPKVQT